MKFPFFKNTGARSSSSPSSSWAWPSCHQPKTLSFRANNTNHNMFKTINSAYLVEVVESPELSFFTESNSPYDESAASFSTFSSDHDIDSRRGVVDHHVETVIRGLRSDRLFFEPDEKSSNIFESKASSSSFPIFKDSVVLSLASNDPYVDFRKSMEEMVQAHGVKDWEGLEELLGWYLKVNVKSNYGYIVGAFVDLLVGLAFDESASSPSDSSSSSLCVSCLEGEKKEVIINCPSSCLKLEQVKEEITQEDEDEA